MAAAAVSKQSHALASTDTAMDVDNPLEQQQDDQEDLYTRLKTLQRQLEFFEIQVRCRSLAHRQRSFFFLFDLTGIFPCSGRLLCGAAACCVLLGVLQGLLVPDGSQPRFAPFNTVLAILKIILRLCTYIVPRHLSHGNCRAYQWALGSSAGLL